MTNLINKEVLSQVKIDCRDMTPSHKRAVFNFFKVHVDNQPEVREGPSWEKMSVIYPHSQGFSNVGWDYNLDDYDCYPITLTKKDLGGLI